MQMERYLSLMRVNLKISILPYLIICIAMCLISPFLMGVECLNEYDVAKIIEVYLSLTGILLIVPIFSPEQDKNIRDVIYTKKTSVLSIYILRFIMAFLFIVVISVTFLLFLKYNECQFSFLKLLFCSIANALFLGSLGLVAYALSDNQIIGYMIPIFYYILNFGAGSKILGKYYLFSMMRGELSNKWWIFTTGAILVALAIGIKGYENKLGLRNIR